MDSRQENRRVSIGSTTNDSLQNQMKNSIQPFRSLRMNNKREKITKTPDCSIILEGGESDSGAVVEYRSAAESDNNEGNSIRPASCGSKINFDKIVVYDRTISHSGNSLQSSNRSNKSNRNFSRKEGAHVNHGYHGQSNLSLNSNTTLQSSGTAVIREQYWSCSCCKKWTKRERVLVIVITSLTIIILGLVIAIGLVSDKDRTKLFDGLT